MGWASGQNAHPTRISDLLWGGRPACRPTPQEFQISCGVGVRAECPPHKNFRSLVGWASRLRPTPQEFQISCGVGVPPALCSVYLYSPTYCRSSTIHNPSGFIDKPMRETP
ncbi:hypothetical protein [Microseira wollei]|uniref:hypothetical protein n=1 Tax=Microseira wollei TaxID=467598 RepID=UPI001CFE5A7E|nr:hypothetical protein [Microseira wollei]